MMTIASLLSPDRVFSNLRAGDKRQALQELARLTGLAEPDEAAILAALIRREELGSTGLGRGVALPHARIPSLAAPVGVFARLTRPIAFEAIDEAPVDIVFLLLLPDADPDSGGASAATAALATVARCLRDQATLARLRSGDTPAELYAVLTQSPGA